MDLQIESWTTICEESGQSTLNEECIYLILILRYAAVITLILWPWIKYATFKHDGKRESDLKFWLSPYMVASTNYSYDSSTSIHEIPEESKSKGYDHSVDCRIRRNILNLEYWKRKSVDLTNFPCLALQYFFFWSHL